MSPAPLILVVEDNQPLRRMVVLTLTTAGYRVVPAGNAHEALGVAENELPALVITDLMLPDLDGSQLLDQLRDVPGAERLPVVAVSGSRAKLEALRSEGTNFTESLLKPVPPSQLVALAAKHAPLRASASEVGGGHKLLLVDDTAVQRKLTALQLERVGFDVTPARDGAEALRLARAVRPDAIVSDVLMPVLDGFELCRAIRADPELHELPVVLMTSAYVNAEDEQLGLRAGANAYLERGADLRDLQRALCACLGAGPIPPAEPFPEFELEHARRVRCQLESHVAANAALSEQLELTEVQLSVVAGIASVLTRAIDASEVLEEALTRCLEVAGLVAGVAWLRNECGGLECSARAGEEATAMSLRGTVERLTITGELENAGPPLTLPFDDRGFAGVVGSLVAGGEPLGVIAIAWRDVELTEQRVGFVRTIAGQLSEAIAVRRAIDELDCSREETISRLALAAEFRDNDTARHTERVGLYSKLIAQRLGLGEERVELIRVASVMHDVGKIGVSDTILLKPGPLTEDEFEQMKLHTTIGHRILGGSGVELLDLAATIALNHHERVDGTGYPAGLRGEEIPIEGRIVAVADVFDALTSQRVYRPAFTVESAVETMRAGSATQFDAHVLDTFLDALDEVLEIYADGAVPVLRAG